MKQSTDASSLSLRDRISGCLLGGACGDALGWPVEFLELSQITDKYGPAGISHFGQTLGGQITDDTQMTLFTVEGLIRAYVRGKLKGISNPPAEVHHAYVRWLETQQPGSYRAAIGQEPDSWLITERRLWAQRAPGNTCLAALRSRRSLGAPVENNSKGCGTVMCSAPFGFVTSWWDVPAAFELAVECARSTHGHPPGYYATGAFAAIIALIVEGFDLRDAAREAVSILQSFVDAHEVRSSLEYALQLASATDWRDMLSRLGQGWVAEEALAIA